MKIISDQLQTIAADLGAVYTRSNSLEESNLQTHFKAADNPLIYYVGFGEVENSFAGAMPVKAVAVEVYVLQKKPTIDALAEDVDTVLAEMEQLSSDIIRSFKTYSAIIEYNLEPVLVFDDLLIGYRLSFTPELEAPHCEAPAP